MTENEEKDPTCESCFYWKKAINLQDLKNVVGECHGRPPQIMGIPVQTPQGMGMNVQTMFPSVGAAGYCALHPEIALGYEIEKTKAISEFMQDNFADFPQDEKEPVEVPPVPPKKKK